jgi:tetratricopeptide (TPR) repeat protein
MTYFEEATKKGKVATEADKHAARALTDNPMPNMKLAKVRYSTDGGYYDTAIRLLRSIRTEDIPTPRETTEFNYRYARLYHKLSDLEKAKSYYLKTITLTGQESWYFAPNSCLQLGYIYVSENNTAEARNYFNKALSYKKHEYKNSIDSKAKSALVQLKK